MIRIKDHKIRSMFDPFAHLGPKRRRMIDESWSGVFRKYILTEFLVKQLARHFPSREGHPIKELYAMMGALLVQQMIDLTEEKTAR